MIHEAGLKSVFQIVQRKPRQVCCLLLLRSLDIYIQWRSGQVMEVGWFSAVFSLSDSLHEFYLGHCMNIF